MANANANSVLVVGLGRFGSAVAQTLNDLGQDLLAVDKNPTLVARWSSVFNVVEADMTDMLAVEQIGASDFQKAVVAIGDGVEASVLTAGNLLDAGLTDIWAKSVSKEHTRILQRMGVRHIISAESDAGKRVGHLIAGDYLDYIEIEGPYTVVKIHTPASMVNKTVGQARVRERFGITVIGAITPGLPFRHGDEDTVMHRTDELIVLGMQDQIDRFIRE
ncbi:potassium channel family protein [Bifidobacterium vespertilionis]|uniref:TrkA family potassium uptake protein n=1 Tax=Bifidobacterium vespertilionis TaxID=2562524 RepID=A0A5J5E5J3_9BIFI|nr:TrkA family potassium uptake protein [Bifidobacterium vespertilionis]KAA8822490.1 TrkA family potassium uptake protein [Bifidobacterium vespertilionis]KAA8824448.1 TrkA family potassium uptake protein [Bifidobacterium vespertilionis]